MVGAPPTQLGRVGRRQGPPAHTEAVIRLEDIGLAPTTQPAPEPTGPVMDGPPAPERGTVEARTLWEVWRGRPVTVVSSPPGAGKSTLVVSLTRRLHEDANLRVVVAVPTVVAAEELAQRIAEHMGSDQVVLYGTAFSRDVPGVQNAYTKAQREAFNGAGVVQIRTVESCRKSPPDVDVLIFDEAYQTTFGKAAAAAALADQVLMVGDPGQIGPVITSETTPWDRMRVAPHHRAPEVFALRDDAVSLHLPSTYRLGKASAAAVAPLYDFTFDSRRPDLSVAGVDELEAVEVAPSDWVAAPHAMRAAVDRVEDLMGRTVTHQGGRHDLDELDLCVVAPRNEQITALRGLLRERDLGRVKVGTADSLQGGQWAAVVAVDPFFGAPSGSAHSRSLGRLCVMASRHFAHLSWVTSPDVRDTIKAVDMPRAERSAHLRVRRALAGGSAR